MTTATVYSARGFQESQRPESTEARTRGTTLFARCTHALFSKDARPTRVVMLLIATLIMACGDLALTLNYITSIGMVELNPVARIIMKTGSATGIILWKALLTSLSLGILYRFRSRGIVEVAAWIGVLVMLALTVHWMQFIAGVHEMAAEYGAIAAAGGMHEGWVILN